MRTANNKGGQEGGGRGEAQRKVTRRGVDDGDEARGRGAKSR